jgi:heme exporter protein C
VFRRLFPVALGGVAVLGIINLYLALLWSPPERQMGNLVRILYFHVACATVAFAAFGVTALFAILYLVRRRLPYDLIAASSAEIGVMFTTLTLITGSLWGRPTWNTWWTWDPLLTTTLILWFLYIGYLLLRGTLDGLERRARVSAIFAIIAFVDVPIIHMSVTWWRSIHPTVISDTSVNMPSSMVVALLFSLLFFFCIYLLFLTLRYRLEAQRVKLLQLKAQILDVRRLKSEEWK